MKTQQDYMMIIKGEFNEYITQNASAFKKYGYDNRDADNYIKDFMDMIKTIGLKFSNCYHANGIGNNNEYIIYKEKIDEDGFLVKKEIAEFYYCHGIFGGCYISLKDLITNNKIAVGHAR